MTVKNITKTDREYYAELCEKDVYKRQIQGTPKEQQSFCKKAFWKQRRKLRSLLRCPEK